MADRLTFTGPVPPPPGRRLGWVVVVAIVLCMVSVVILTLALPDGGQFTKGGYIPITTGAR